MIVLKDRTHVQYEMCETAQKNVLPHGTGNTNYSVSWNVFFLNFNNGSKKCFFIDMQLFQMSNKILNNSASETRLHVDKTSVYLEMHLYTGI